MKSLKTCLRYPGGKSRAITKLSQFFPDFSNYKQFREPFVGGGSVAIYITKMNPSLSIWVNDLYEPLYTFWNQLQNDGIRMRNELVQLKNRYCDPTSARNLFQQAKDYLNETNSEPFHRAVSFYVLNKCSFSGLTESSSFSPAASESNFSMRGIEKLPEYSELIKNWKITNFSYEIMMDCDSEVFLYLDPPYDIKDNLYGKRGSMHKGFDHDKFASDCNLNKSQPMLISYNSDQLVRDRFSDWNTAEFSHTYTMRSVGSYNKDQQERKELLLLNYEV